MNFYVVPLQSNISGTSDGALLHAVPSFIYMRDRTTLNSKSLDASDILSLYLRTIYLEEKDVNYHDVLQFWKSYNQNQLEKVAYCYYTIAPTSVSSERLFSEVGNIKTKLRN